MITKSALIVGVVSVGAASADQLFVDSLTSDSGAWNVTNGAWLHDSSGMSNVSSGENRAFVDVLGGRTSYAVEFDATLSSGMGWGVWLSSSVDANDKVSGYTFQYDPGWNPDSYLFRNWDSNVESVLEHVDLDVEYGKSLSFRFEVDGDTISAFQDGELVLQSNTIDEHNGDLIGFRTWGGSQATFSNMSVSTIPAPSAGAVAMAGLALLAGVRLRRK